MDISELEASIEKSRKTQLNLMLFDFGVRLKMIFDCIISTNFQYFKSLGYESLTVEEVKFL